MAVLEIKLNNPITEKEIQKLKTKLITSKGYEFLIIDVGKHQFESTNVIKLMREELEKLEADLLEFKKIAFVVPPQFVNGNNILKTLKYFSSKTDAKRWVVS